MEKLQTFIKWPGGKSTEIKHFRFLYPKKSKRFFEPFLGGGAVYFDFANKITDNAYFVNDKSFDLINVYELIKRKDPIFIDYLQNISETWIEIEGICEGNKNYFENLFRRYSTREIDDIVLYNKLVEFNYKHSRDFQMMFKSKFNPEIEKFTVVLIKTIIRKFKRLIKIEKENEINITRNDFYQNLETAFKGSYYTHLRYIYNNLSTYSISNEVRGALFYFIREYCYSSMFRFNKSGEFNVPYGGIGYNSKNIGKKLNYVLSDNMQKLLKKTKIYCMDFEDFMKKFRFKETDFIFLDPPYDTEFSSYDGNSFDKKDQVRLANFVKSTKAKVMLVIKNTDFILDLYNNSGLYIYDFNKKYSVNFQSRNERKVNHLIITNYKEEN